MRGKDRSVITKNLAVAFNLQNKTRAKQEDIPTEADVVMGQYLAKLETRRKAYMCRQFPGTFYG